MLEACDVLQPITTQIAAEAKGSERRERPRLKEKPLEASKGKKKEKESNQKREERETALDPMAPSVDLICIPRLKAKGERKSFL